MSSRQELVDWMRVNGVTEAEFDEHGNLLVCQLGPKPPADGKPKEPQRDPVADRRATLLGAANRLTRGERIGNGNG